MKTISVILFLLFSLSLSGFGQAGKRELQTKRVAILQVMDLTEVAEDQINAGVKLFVRNSLASAITNMPGYEGYDRVNLSEISGEQQFQHSGTVRDDDVKKIGEATGAQYVLIVEMAKFDDMHYTISAKIIDVETLKMEGITSILCGSGIEDIKEACTNVAGRLLKIPGYNDFKGRNKDVSSRRSDDQSETERDLAGILSRGNVDEQSLKKEINELNADQKSAGMKSAKYKVLKWKYNHKEYVPQLGDPYSPVGLGFASFFVPGLGQYIAGEAGRGTAYLVSHAAVYIGFIICCAYEEVDVAALAIPVLLTLEICSAVNANRIAKVKNMYHQDLLRKKSGSLGMKLYPSLNMTPVGNSFRPAVGLTLALNF